MADESVDYSVFRKALRNLDTRHRELLDLPADYPPYVRESVAESVIQRFEMCYDALWKALRRHLREEVGVVAPAGPIRILRVAGESGVMPGSAGRWQEYIRARIATTHEYDAEKAGVALTIVPDFIHDAIALYETVTGEDWE